MQEFLSSTVRNKVQAHATTRTTFESAMLNEITQTQKDNDYYRRFLA
jgi:hypothetical protein